MQRSFLYTGLLLGLTISIFELKAQTVSTIAGIQYTDSAKFNATAANDVTQEYFSRPLGVAIDTNNRIYITDEHNVMLIIGNISRNRGGFRGDPTDFQALGSTDGTGLISRFSTPAGCAVHPKTNDIYIADKNNCLIRKGMRFVNSSNEAVWSTMTGKVSFLGGYKDGALSDAEFASPEDLEFDSKGRLFVCDFDNHAIRLINGSNVSTVAGNGSLGFKNGTGSNAQFSYPSGIGLESDSFLLVADRNNKAIRRVNTFTGEVTTIISQGLDYPLDVIKVENVIYILEAQCIKMYVNGKLTVYTGKEGTSGYVNGDISIARFGRMYHFAYMKAQKSFYIPDHYNNVIRRVPLLLSVNSSFSANNTSPIVDQTISIKSSTEYATSLNWEITPSTYTLQAGSKLTDSIIYVSFNSAGSYSVKLKASNSSSSDEELKNNYINVSTNSTAKPVVDFTATKTKPMVNENITLVDLTANNPTSYTWTITPNTYLLQNSTTLTSRNPQLKFTQTGQYTVKLDASNSFGSHSVTKTSYIQVVLTSVMNDLQQPISLKLYPNPSDGTVNIDGLPESSIITVYDATGRNVLNTTNPQFVLNPGAYYISVHNNENRWSLGKIIVID